MTRVPLAAAFVVLPLILTPLWAADLVPPRVFFADASISVGFPSQWSLDDAFPSGPLFIKKSDDDPPTVLTCRLSKALGSDHLSSDMPYDLLQAFETKDMATSHPNARIVTSQQRMLADHHALEMTWIDQTTTPATECQSDYFFNIDRVYALSLESTVDHFSPRQPEFQEWLYTLRFLSRRNSSALDSPARGGVWVHQTAGIKITFPDDWLIGVASDRIVGATTVDGDQHSEWTATDDPGAPAEELSPKEKSEAKLALEKKGYQVVEESEEPFHDLPAYRIAYQATINDRFVKGEDLWVAGTKSRWLFNFEADGVLFNRLAVTYKGILDDIEFL